ncbi:hypothetical protein OE88DRAFT_1734056 [Heliocybe sulcata]|uniref:Ubiquitin 3 binding protein But2 C-terminal domain-containing protein n=1 Tax=Heliocybe sulcata TaxID=5364 RepID=A0A5C3N7R4_9AGAM|nr:hypothetical protein OE88DRAFT_1734056 [Heliocybe sulcata]
MERRSPFVGLDRLNIASEVSMLGPQANYPIAILAAEETATGKAEYSYSSAFILSPRQHMIMQFRIWDHGLEQCSVRFEAPVLDGVKPEPLETSANASVVVTKLALEDLLPPVFEDQGYPWAIDKHLGVLSFHAAANSSTDWYPCPRDSLQTLELKCQSEDCLVKFTQARSVSHFGVRIYQKGG